MGFVIPKPAVVRRVASTLNCDTRTALTASARRFDRSGLCSALPTESVCPSISSFRLGFVSRPRATALMIGADSGFSRSLSVSNRMPCVTYRPEELIAWLKSGDDSAKRTNWKPTYPSHLRPQLH